MRVLLACALGLLACGDDSSVADASASDGGVDAPALDAPGFDAPTIDSAIDAPGVDVPGIDAPGVDAPGSDAGMECGTGEPAVGWNVPMTCLRAECFEHPTCVAADLEAAGYGDHSLCGTIEITPASSLEACMTEPPFGPFPDAPTPDCGRVEYEGNVSFFCNAARTSIAARFVATHTDTSASGYDYLGHEFWAGSGGGSGDSRYHSDYIDIHTTRFYGWQRVVVEEDSSTQLQVWFMSGNFAPPGMFYTGGFSSRVPPSE